MGHITTGRRRHIAKNGRPMLLRRAGLADLTVQGFSRPGKSHELVAGATIGDAWVEITNDEIVANSWPGPPKKPDTVFMDGKSHVIQLAPAVHDGAAVAGYTLWVRG